MIHWLPCSYRTEAKTGRGRTGWERIHIPPAQALHATDV